MFAKRVKKSIIGPEILKNMIEYVGKIAITLKKSELRRDTIVSREELA